MAGSCQVLNNFFSVCSVLQQPSHAFLLYLQVKSGTLFDNSLITDDAALAKTFAEETWAKHKDVCYTYLALSSCNLFFLHHVLMVTSLAG